MEEEKRNKINFDDEDTVCPKCGAYGVYIPPYKENDDGTITATFKCHNGHIFTKKYPLKGELGES
jgi:hypothetical protein